MKKILVIQSRKDSTRLQFESDTYTRIINGRATCSYISTFDPTIDWSNTQTLLEGIDGIIIGGSSDYFLDGGVEETDEARARARVLVEQIRPFIERVIERDIPTIGICFGHQLIAEIRGGNVTHDHKQKKMGTYDVILNEEGKRDAIFSQMPPVFAGQYAHRDSVTTLPQSATLLASGDSCKFSLLRYGAHVYTFQFHPELEVSDLLQVREVAATYLEPGVSVESVVRESPEASTIIGRWVDRIVSL